MLNNYLKGSLSCALAAFAIAANAQVTPKVTGEALETGKQYVLFNKAQNANQYMSRTSWDGALYFLGKNDSNYATHAFTAKKNDDGTWSFYQTTAETDEEGAVTETTLYMAMPFGSTNLNIKSEEPAVWFVTEGKGAGFYQLSPGEGNNANTFGMKLHLNGSGQYFIISEKADGASWWPDFYGGAERWEDESIGEEFATPLDSTSFNWAFVQTENVETYAMDMEVVSLINDLKANYCDFEDYATGFELTYSTVAAIYESPNYEFDNDREPIIAMVNGKKALYQEIEAAIALNETDDIILNAAIAKAKQVFDNTTDADAIVSATTALKNAELAYSQGSGDYTALGANMSFEDLSAQYGSETSGVAGAPAGWNVYVNGNQVVTADEVKAAGFGAWHGVNSDSNGEIKDGKESFGIWNNAIPTYEISQTIDGLENGTYIVTAGLMAGSNGNGSRLTTQRIFGNLNSTYYAAEEEYVKSELDASEVYAFAGNEILNTDQEMRPVSVRAYVYDGTLTFGVRTDGNYAANGRSSNNGAGGDGWFKTDNFTIHSEGYVAEDAIAVLDHYREAIYDCQDYLMDNETSDKLGEQADNFNGLDEDSPQADINNAILGAKALLEEATYSVKAYQKLENAINQHMMYLEQYANKSGAGEYSDVIIAALEGHDEGTINPSEIDDIIAGLEAALQACIQSDEIEEGADLTDYIKNASFEDLSAQNGSNSGGLAPTPAGWNLYMNGEKVTTVADITAASPETVWCAINGGDNLDNVVNTYGEQVYVQYTDGEHLWGVWSPVIPEFELSQTISHLPAGTYTLSADIVVQNDWAGNNLGTQRLFANEYVCMYGSEDDYIWNFDEGTEYELPADMVGAKAIDAEYPEAALKHLTYACNYSSENYGASSAPYTTTITFGVANAGDNVTFGVRSSRLSAFDGAISSQASMGWLKVDNFRLTYVSAEVPEASEATDIQSAPVAAQCVEFFNANGVRLSAPQRGINIIKMSDGNVQKVMVK